MRVCVSSRKGLLVLTGQHRLICCRLAEHVRWPGAQGVTVLLLPATGHDVALISGLWQGRERPCFSPDLNSTYSVLQAVLGSIWAGRWIAIRLVPRRRSDQGLLVLPLASWPPSFRVMSFVLCGCETPEWTLEEHDNVSGLGTISILVF